MTLQNRPKPSRNDFIRKSEQRTAHLCDDAADLKEQFEALIKARRTDEAEKLAIILEYILSDMKVITQDLNTKFKEEMHSIMQNVRKIERDRQN